MTTFGFHYFPDETHYRASDLAAWLPELKALEARWLTLVGSLTQAVPEPFLKGLLEAGIEPIIHVPVAPIRAIDLPAVAPLLNIYGRWGVKHVVIYAEPNARSSWSPAEWGKTALVERFLDLLVPVLRAQVEAGLHPVFPALKAGGEYWDTAFLEAALAGLARREQMELARRLTFAVNLWTFNRPGDWGAGGLAQWPAVRPYLTPPGSQDQRGFHLFDWYNEIISARLGEARPLLCLAGGPRLGDQTDPVLPVVDEARHRTCTEEVLHAVESEALPTNLLNVNFWLLAAADGPFTGEAWYRTDGRTLPAVEAAKRYAARARRPKFAPHGTAPSDGKVIEHYLLLPTFEWGISEWHWQAALAYVQKHHPTCGFSAAEAARAQRVTIFGNEQGVSREAEEALRRAGCMVERVVLKK